MMKSLSVLLQGIAVSIVIAGCQCDEFYTDDEEKMSVYQKYHQPYGDGSWVQVKLERSAETGMAARLRCEWTLFRKKETVSLRRSSISIYNESQTKLYGVSHSYEDYVYLPEVPERISVVCRFVLEADADTTRERVVRFENLRLETICRGIHGLH